MKVLVDTHVALWATREPHRLSSHAQHLFETEQTDLLLSNASLWEIAIKSSKRMLDLRMSFSQFVQDLTSFGFLALPIKLAHLEASSRLPLLHGDPFDRLIVCQSQVERVPLLTVDARLREYPIATIW